MLKQTLTGIAILFSAGSFCAASALNIQLQTSAAANLNEAKQAAPLPISLFVLADKEQFSKLGYFKLEDNGRRSLGAAYVSKRSFVLAPNARRNIVLNPKDGARYLGLIGGYNSLKGKKWRRVIKLSDVARKNVIARFNRYGVQLRYTDSVVKTRHDFYFDGNINLGLISASSTAFNYSSLNRARLDINSSYMLGQLGIGGGYQWLFDSWLQKASVGVGFYYTPLINISGNVVSNLDNLGSQAARPFTISSNSEDVLLEGRINMFRFAKHFTNYVDGGIGMAFYNSHYKRNSSSGHQLDKESSSSDMIYKLGFGVEYDLDQNMSMSLGYQYISPSKMRVQEITDTNGSVSTSPTITLNKHMLAFKLRYLF